MHLHPLADVGLRVLSLIWAGCMLLAGLWLAAGEVQALGAVRRPALWAGVGLVAGGQVVFLAMVADRYFPRAHPVLVLACELGSFGVFVAGLGRAAWMLAVE